MATYALIPGGGGDPWEWHRLVPELASRGHHAIAVRLPAEAQARTWQDQSMTPLDEPWPLDSWPDVPTRVLAGRHDRMFPLDFQRRVARERLATPAAVPITHVKPVREWLTRSLSKPAAFSRHSHVGDIKSPNQTEENRMQIKLTSVYVDNQDKALRFYTEVLGFLKKADVSNGSYRWLTVVSPEEPDGTELQLALNDNPAAKAYQHALFQQSQPAAMFFTRDVKADSERIKARGAEFTMPPTDVTGATIANLNDTCGNLIQITQLARS